MKLSKLLFILSFAPAGLLLMAAVMSIFTGSTWFFSKEYGFDVFPLKAQDDDWAEKVIARASQVREKQKMMQKM